MKKLNASTLERHFSNYNSSPVPQPQISPTAISCPQNLFVEYCKATIPQKILMLEQFPQLRILIAKLTYQKAQRNKTLTTLQKMFPDPKTYDLVICCDKQEFHVHKCIIARTKALKELISTSSKKIVQPKAFATILEYLYIDKVKEFGDICNLLSIYHLANKYQLSKLSNIVLKHLKENVLSNVDSAIAVLKEANNLNLHNIVNLCLRFLREKQVELLNKSTNQLGTYDSEVLAIILKHLLAGQGQAGSDFQEYQTQSEPDIICHIRSLYNCKAYSDVILESEDKTHFYAHKVILRAFNEYFYNMWNHNFSESTEKVIKLEKVGKEALEFILKAIYQIPTGFPQNIESLFEIFNFARMSNATTVMNSTIKQLIDRIDVNNVLKVMEMCDIFSIEVDLQQQLFDTILRKIPAFELLKLCQNLQKDVKFYQKENNNLKVELYFYKTQVEMSNDANQQSELKKRVREDESFVHEIEPKKVKTEEEDSRLEMNIKTEDYFL